VRVEAARRVAQVGVAGGRRRGATPPSPPSSRRNAPAVPTSHRLQWVRCPCRLEALRRGPFKTEPRGSNPFKSTTTRDYSGYDPH
jgi:hypothetical protein